MLGFVAVSAGAAIVYSACLLLVGERLLGMLYGNGYVAFTRIVPLLSCNLILITASQGVQMGLRAMNAPRHVFVAFLIGELCTCTFGLAFTWAWGIQGASLGLCLSTLSFVSVIGFRFYKVISQQRSRTCPDRPEWDGSRDRRAVVELPTLACR